MPAIVLLCLAYRMTTALALTLNEDERTWLAAHPELRLGVDVSWPSFEFRDEQGNDHGLTAAYVRLIEERLDVKLQPVEPSNWSAILEQPHMGQVDQLPGVMSTPKRQEYLIFTRPYLDLPIAILARNGGPQSRKLNERYGLKIAVVADYAPHELLRQQHPDLNLLPLRNIAAALQALATNQVDAMVGDLASSVWSLRQLKLDGVYISGETLYRYQVAMAAPRGQSMLVGTRQTLRRAQHRRNRCLAGTLGRQRAGQTQRLARNPALRPASPARSAGGHRHHPAPQPPPETRDAQPRSAGAGTT